MEGESAMRKDWKYILYLSVAFGLFAWVKLMSPKPINWRVTFGHDDHNPFGGYVLNELLPSVFGDTGIHHSYETLYEIKDSLKRNGNILILCSNFSAGKEDTDALLKHVEKGGTALIAAGQFWGHFADTLKLSTRDYLFKDGVIALPVEDSASLHFVNYALDTIRQFNFKRDNIHDYFNKFDTTRTSVIAVNELGQPVALRVTWGKGSLILNSTPLAFTNIYLLSDPNHEFPSTLLSYLPHGHLEWTEYYHLGRMEAATPLRFILTNEALRWAYYLVIVSLLIFMIFEMKRRQRIIPVIKPLANTTLEFVSTIGNLYYQNGEHKNIAEKKISFFLEHIRTRFWISTTKMDEEFIRMLNRKSGIPENEIRALLTAMAIIHSKQEVTAQELVDLNRTIERMEEWMNGTRKQ
jgi:hypothetical protein